MCRQLFKSKWIGGPAAWAGIAVLLAGCGRGGEESVEDFPSRSLSLICPWAAGGGTDTCSRIVADELSTALGQRVNVYNRTGGAGVTGHSAGANADPDGYTLTMITVEICMMHWRDLTEIGPGNFRPLHLMNKVAGSAIVQQESSWQSLSDLVNAVKAGPGELTASGTAKGGIWHLTCAGFLLAADLNATDIIWVPSEGAAPGLKELISGGIDVAFCAVPEALPQIEGGKARCLAEFSAKRNPQFPDVPTAKEQGVDFEIYGWAGLAAPIGTPEPICLKLEEALAKVSTSESFRTAMTNAGFIVDTENAEGFRNILQRDDEKFGKLLRAAGIVK